MLVYFSSDSLSKLFRGDATFIRYSSVSVPESSSFFKVFQNSRTYFIFGLSLFVHDIGGHIAKYCSLFGQNVYMTEASDM